MRDLVRARATAGRVLAQARQHLQGFLLRHDRIYHLPRAWTLEPLSDGVRKGSMRLFAAADAVAKRTAELMGERKPEAEVVPLRVRQ
jgi:hypothetical protein